MPFKFNPFTSNLDYYYDETGVNTGDVTLTTIGSSPNANAASLSGQQLQLQPASGSFGGVVTTTTQSFAGNKTFNGVIAHKLGTSLLPAVVPTGDTDTGIWSAGANSLSISTIATERIRIGVNNSGFINVHGNFTSQTYGLLLNGMAANVPTFGLRLANGQSVNLVDLVTYAGSVFGSITKDGYINFPLGSASTPTYSFVGSSNDCGMYSSGSDALNFSTAGRERLRFLSGGVINTGGNYTDTTAGFQMSALGTTTPILYLKHIASGTSDYLLCRDSSNTTKLNINYQGRVFADGGSAGAASYCFTNSSKSGMYHAGDETIAFATYTTERFSIDKEGNLRAYTLHNNATPNGNSQEQDIRSGSEYAATITNTNKIYDVALEKMQWLRVGNVVTVSGYGTASSIDAADYSFEISLPVASDFSDERQCAGVFMGYQNSLEPSNAIIKAETTNDTAYVSGFEPTGLTEVQIVVHFTYLVVSG